MLLSAYSFTDTLSALFGRFSAMLSTPWILKTLAFAVMVGSVMALMKRSGGVYGFVHAVAERSRLVRSPRSALLLTYAVGVFIFIESSITSLIAGAVGKPVCDRYKVSRAKLAYVCDATSAPVCSIILFNGWGALLLGLISVQVGSGALEGDSVAWLLAALPYNFYAFSALAVLFAVIWFNIDIGPMRHAAVRHEVSVTRPGKKAGHMVWPIAVMMLSVFGMLYYTGEGNLLHGSGSTSIFWALIITLLFTLLYYLKDGVMRMGEWAEHSLRGAWQMAPIALILLFAFAIGDITKELQTGLYLASFAKSVFSPQWLAAVIFLLAAVMAFATGTSWGTFSIMIPIAVPMALGLDANVALCIGAVISGGVFGDHCSPISDTTIISSMAAGCDHVEHVATQLPYALISGFVALLGFMLLGWLG